MINYIDKMNVTTVEKIQAWLDDEIAMSKCLEEEEVADIDDAISYGRTEMAKALLTYIEQIKDAK